MRLLLIEDDTRLVESLRRQLRDAGFAVDVSTDGVEGLYLGEEFPIDLAIIDLGLPELPGLEVIRKLRSRGRHFPILVLTARSEWQDKVAGLEAGADDYLTKPFHVEELLARVNALLRRTGGHARPEVRFGPFTVDLSGQRVFHGKAEIELTTYEYKVLQFLMLRERFRALKAAGLDNLLLSVDSIDAAAHDAHRGIPGLHAKVVERLRWISEDFLTGCHTGGMMCVLSSGNVRQVPRLVALAEELGVYLVVQPYHHKTGDSSYRPPITAETVEQLLELKMSSGALLSSTGYLAGMAGFCQGAARPRCQAGRKYFSIDPYGYLHPCVDSPAVGHVLRDELSVVRSAEAQRAVSSCAGCWYCFRGEADSTLSLCGYAEKVRLAGAVMLRNGLRAAHGPSRRAPSPDRARPGSRSAVELRPGL